MIDEIQIRDVGVIGSAHIRLAPGLTVLTGETGAGKTMVVTALQLLLGARADAGLVRAGAGSAVVEGRIHPVPESLRAAELVAADEDELIVSREVVDGDGGARSRVRLGGRLATVSVLAETIGQLVEVHGQGEHNRLARPAVQRELLDRYAGPDHATVLDRYARTYGRLAEGRDRLERLRADARGRAREIDRLRQETAEIAAADLDPDIDDRIDDQIARLEHGEQLVEAAAGAAAALDEGGAGAPLGDAVAALRRASGHDPALDALLARAEGLAAESLDLRAELRDYAARVELDAGRLEELRQRRRLLNDLTRRYGADVGEVLAYADEASVRLEELETDETDVEALADEVDELAAAIDELAADLRASRRAAGERLAAAVVEQLEDLAMPHARFSVEVEPLEEPGPSGGDRVTYLFGANPGEPVGPFGELASGGERSRVALAAEVALADAEQARVLVFDEVDAGVGGEAAMSVGRKLAELARHGPSARQVLCVTHLAQLAAFADTHYVVDKHVRGGRTETDLRMVDEDDRAAELARMLSGSAGRSEAIEHARRILEEAADRQVRGGVEPDD